MKQDTLRINHILLYKGRLYAKTTVICRTEQNRTLFTSDLNITVHRHIALLVRLIGITHFID